MEAAVIALPSGVKRSVLGSVDSLIRVYEGRVRRNKLSTLTTRLRKAVKDHYEEREIEAIVKLKWAWKQKMEAVSNTDWIAMHVFDLDEEAELLSSVFQPFYIEAGEAGRQYALKHLSGVLGREVIYKGATIWVQNNAIKFGKKYANEVSKTTNQAIRDGIADAIKQGEDLNAVMDRIAKVYRAAEGYRSEMIARTEMSRAYSLSSIDQDAALGIKLWNWEGCDPNCEICGPFMANGPYTRAELYSSIPLHPNCDGYEESEVPDDFVPNEVY